MREVTLGRSELLELSAEVLARGGTFHFRARGGSMRPFIRDGDLLTIEPSPADSLHLGDVALYKSSGNRLTVHRVVGATATEGWVVYLMRGDAQAGPTERISAEQVLGRCVALRRGDRTLDLHHPTQRWISRLWQKTWPIGPRLLRLGGLAYRAALGLLGCVQALRPYRVLARQWVRGRTDFRLATARDAPALSRLYAYERLPQVGDPVAEIADQLSGADPNGCIFIATFRHRLIGAVGLRVYPDDAERYPDWWLSGLRVQARYRGMGIGEGLVHAALARARVEGTPRVHLLVFEDNKRAINLYRKLGFRPTSIPALDAQLASDAQAGQRHRVILAWSAASSSLGQNASLRYVGT